MNGNHDAGVATQAPSAALTIDGEALYAHPARVPVLDARERMKVMLAKARSEDVGDAGTGRPLIDDLRVGYAEVPQGVETLGFEGSKEGGE